MVISLKCPLSLNTKQGLSQESLAQRVVLERDSAVAKTTQMLAHDVRKPFSILKSISETIDAIQDKNEAIDFLKESLPEVNQAMASVEGLIQDVMQIGSDAKPNLEEISVGSLLESTLGELFRVYPDANVSLIYSLNHSQLLMVDSVRVGRIFSNILGNALQAMGNKGKIWISTQPSGGYVEFRLGNSGSAIPATNLPLLFDAFFTSEKKGGTGLGLAIAKKVVELHGGKIRCESEVNETNPDGFVEFVFTLPASTVVENSHKHALHAHSRIFQTSIAKSRLGPELPVEFRNRESELESLLLNRLLLTNSVPRLLIVDDEAVYRNNIKALIEKNSDLFSKLQVYYAMNDTEAIDLAIEHRPILLIQDVDLGNGSTNGIEIVKKLRNENFLGQICIHSNRFLFEDNKIALDAGANCVLPKPMSRAHLLTLILAALPEDSKSQEPENSISSFAFVDDSMTFLISMKQRIQTEAKVHTFSSTFKFFDAVRSDPAFLRSLDFIVTDFHFATNDPHDGVSFAKELRKLGFAKPILLASGGEFDPADFGEVINGRVDKSADWNGLKRWTLS